MKKIAFAICLLVSLAHAQIYCDKGQECPASGEGGTFSLTRVGGRCVRAANMACSAAVITLTVPSTTSGHAGALFVMDTAGSGITISSISGACTWTVQSSIHASTGPVGDINGATCTGMSAGVTSLTITMSATMAGQD